MFGLTLVDHLRLTFGHVIYTHRGHTRLALQYAQWNRGLQCAEAVLVMATATLALTFAQSADSRQAIAAAVAAVLALLILLIRLIFDFDRQTLTHRVCGAQLWHLREEYRALLADLQDGGISPDTARDRRDALMQRLHDVYENAPPLDRASYEAARAALPAQHEAALTDEEVDRFLPDSLKKSGSSAA